MSSRLPSALGNPCSEPACDREAAPGDARCLLHASRLGASPGIVVSREAPISSNETAPAPVRAAPAASEEPEGEWQGFATVAGGSVVAFWAALLFSQPFLTSLFAVDMNNYGAAGRPQVAVPWVALGLAVVALLVGPIAGLLAVPRAGKGDARLLCWALVAAAALPIVAIGLWIALAVLLSVVSMLR